MSSGKQYTWKDVAEHNNEKSCWVAIDKKVYDITNFLEKHPGGKEYLLLAAGRDCTDLFHSYHNLTKTPEALLPKYQIGTLVGDTEFTHFKPDSGFYKECCDNVNDYFKKNNLHPKDPVPGLMRLVLFLSVMATCFYISYFSAVSFPVRVITAIIYGWLQAMILIHQMHDSCHSALGYSPAWWKFFGRLTQEWIAGASMVAWHNQHVVGHHVYTNIMGADPDLPVCDQGDLRRIVKRQVWTHFYRYQHIYMPLLYGFLTVKVRFQDLTETFINRMNGPIRVNPIASNQWINIVLCKTGNIFYLLGVPIIWGVIGWKSVILLWVLQDLICGYYLAFNFQVSHVSTEAYFPCDSKIDPNLKDEWAVAQVVTSVDYGHENNIWAFLSGALNYQTVHHLFPGVSQYHYPAIAPIIMKVCKKWGIPYNHIDGGLVPAVKMHVQYLKDMGNQVQCAHRYSSPSGSSSKKVKSQ